jgi:polysaccharide deacetylase family protein (PEP-CTERM system associated)
MLNALSIDVEEYFQVTGLEGAIKRDTWDAIPSRLMVGLSKVVDILERTGTKATFFILGWVAERCPEAVRLISSRNHEIGIHGYDHSLIYRQDPATFEADVSRALAAVRKVHTGEILGYRAPTFSIREDTLWALDILQKLGLKYDSSIFPFKRERYGIPGSPLGPHEIKPGLIEFPMSVVQILGRPVPVGGGGYFRLYPYAFTSWAVERLNREGRPVMTYLHPWEFDPDQPNVKTDFGNHFRHRVNLDKTASRLERLCRTFRFAPAREVLGI